MDKYKKYFDSEDKLLSEKIKIEPSKLYMKNYVPDIKVYTSPLEEVSKNLLISKIDTKTLSAIHNVSESYVKTLTPVTDYSKSAINFSSIKPDIGKAIKVTTIPNKIGLSEFSKEISKPITMSESYSNRIESIKNATSTSLISTKLIERTNFKMPNIGIESSVRISNSIRDLLKDYPVKIDIDIPSLEEYLDQTNINFSKPSEMTSFILDNTDNARSLTIEEAKTIDSITEAKDDNELIEAYDKGVKIFDGNVELLISYILLIVTIFVSFSNDFYAGTLFGKTIDEFLDPAFKDIHKKAKKLLDSKDSETSKNNNGRE